MTDLDEDIQCLIDFINSGKCSNEQLIEVSKLLRNFNYIEASSTQRNKMMSLLSEWMENNEKV